MSVSPEASTRRTLLRRWLLVIAIVVLTAGGVGAYYVLSSDDDACEEFHQKLIKQYFPGEALDAGHQDRLVEAIYSEGQFTTNEGEVVTKPEGCEPP